MTVTYNFDPATRRIETLCEGDVTLVEVLNHFHLLSLDRTVAAGADVLLDIRSLTSVPEPVELDATVGQLKRVASQLQFGRCAVVADAARTQGVAKMFATAAAEYFRAFRVFASIVDARSWLDAPR
jgi:hypothetical protein